MAVSFTEIKKPEEANLRKKIQLGKYCILSLKCQKQVLCFRESQAKITVLTHLHQEITGTLGDADSPRRECRRKKENQGQNFEH